MISDQNIRQQALDPQHSFIVQAPAGSGKTELLIQRYLSLLNTVNSPEEILAITFTRKAASEMRQRLYHALLLAEQAEPYSEHTRTTWQLARNTLAHSQQLKWDLLSNPNRLRIQTIDSFCQSLIRQMPLLSRLGAALEPSENANELYQMAAENLLLQTHKKPLTQAAINQLLLHLDNNVTQLRDLLMSMLANREQWLPLLEKAHTQEDVRQVLEQHLQHVIQRNLQQAHDYFPIELRNEVIDLIKFAAENLAAQHVSSPITKCQHLTNFPAAQIEDLPLWQGLIEFLITKDEDANWRKASGITVKNGFPAKSSGKNAAEKAFYETQKNRISEVLTLLSEEHDLLEALLALRQSPAFHYPAAQWRTLQALLHLLPLAVEKLQLIFRQQAQIDFNEITQAALQALEEQGSPTDLALRLDYQLKHILVDEFQDTSTTQFRLLELLTSGWQYDDGRTLFLVGDPMQSIYRFRGAEVGLFLRAQRQGIGDIPLTSLQLQSNFRSQANIIDWINATFPKVFPQHEDIASGRVTFMPSVAIRPAQADTVQLHVAAISENNPVNHNKIVDLIRYAQQIDPEGNIAILVRARPHLADIIPQLRQANISYQAIAIEPLKDRSAIQDLTALTRALIHFADRIAWLSILRAPWCGLTLHDLYIISQQPEARTIWQNLHDQKLRQRLSLEGQQRIEYFVTVLQHSFMQRQRLSLRDRVETCWLALHGPATASTEYDLANANTFFNLLSELEQAGTLPDLSLLEQRLAYLFADVGDAGESKIKIMTVHEAKGLEFDTVILPALEKTPAYDREKLLLWFEQTREDQGSELLLAPIKEKHSEKDAIYDYLRRQQKQMNDYESARLLYVAVTRAKQRLFLLSNVQIKETGEIKNASASWINKLWDHCQSSIIWSTATTHAEESSTTPRYLRRLNNEYFLTPAKTHTDATEHHNSIITSHAHNFDQEPHCHSNQTNNSFSQIFGIVLHCLLEQLSKHPKAIWNTLIHTSSWHRQFLQHGLAKSELDNAAKKFKEAAEKILHSDTAAWILRHDHLDAVAEYALTGIINQQVQRFIIDRSFVENNIRWIIDYKTVQPGPTQEFEDFLSEQTEKHQLQLQIYGQLFAELDSRPIRYALYFPLTDSFCPVSSVDRASAS